MSAVLKMHGLDGTLAEADWPALTLEQLRPVIAQFPSLSEPLQLLNNSPRPFSAASVVGTRNGLVFIKRHARAVRDAEGLREEHRFMMHLRSRAAAVPRIFATRDHDTVVEAREWTYETHSVPYGVDAYADAFSWTPFRSSAHARSAGQMLAKLHLAAEGFNAPARASRPLVASFTIFAGRDPRTQWDLYVRHRPSLNNYLEAYKVCDEALDLLAPYHAELLPLLLSLQPLWTHNDLHGSNLFWSDGTEDAHATAAIDFGLCDRTNAVHDLAHAIERSIVQWLTLDTVNGCTQHIPVHLDHLFALLEGYESVRSLSSEEALALAPMIALCHVEFALSEADYFLSILHTEDKARIACEGYLVGHARWLRNSGAELLSAVRAWSQERQTKPRGQSA